MYVPMLRLFPSSPCNAQENGQKDNNDTPSPMLFYVVTSQNNTYVLLHPQATSPLNTATR